MGSLFRLILGVPGAFLITFLLFVGMAYMIKQDAQLDEERDALNISITKQLKDTDLAANREFKRPTLDTPPPPPPSVVDASNRPSLDGVRAQVPTLDVKLNIGTGFNPDRDAQPLVRIPPQYPERCMQRAKAREQVVVEFDVTPEGTTTNPRVIDSTNSCLNSAATKSVERWKYQPKIVENKAEWRRGVQTVVTFELSDG
jgi:periplasmic protein TonB